MRPPNLTALTSDIQREWPGTTVWGKGDQAHQSSTSDHNEDDTPGSKSEQSDADNIPEHRALDIPKLGPITMPILRVLRLRLTDRPVNANRLRYVILEQIIWRKRNGWAPETYNGEFHDHLHISADVADDNNGSAWDIDAVDGEDEAVSQRLEWLAHCLEFGLDKYPNEPAVPAELRNRPVAIVKMLKDLTDRPAVTATPVDGATLAAALREPEAQQAIVDAVNRAEDS